MKKLVIIVLLAFIVMACGGKTESTQATVSVEDEIQMVEEISEEIDQSMQELHEEIDRLSEEIDELLQDI